MTEYPLRATVLVVAILLLSGGCSDPETIPFPEDRQSSGPTVEVSLGGIGVDVEPLDDDRRYTVPRDQVMILFGTGTDTTAGIEQVTVEASLHYDCDGEDGDLPEATPFRYDQAIALPRGDAETEDGFDDPVDPVSGERVRTSRTTGLALFPFAKANELCDIDTLQRSLQKVTVKAKVTAVSYATDEEGNPLDADVDRTLDFELCTPPNDDPCPRPTSEGLPPARAAGP